MIQPLACALLCAALVAACAGGGQPSQGPADGSSPPSIEPTPSPAASVSPGPSASPAPSPSPSAGLAGPLAWAALTSGEAHPARREDHTWTVDPSTRTAYLFGGRDGTRAFGDLWAFDLATDTWRELDPTGDAPARRFGHEAVWVDRIGVVVFAGQADASTFFNDLWAYDPSSDRWTQLAAGGDAPIARYGTCSGVGPDGRLWISHGFTEDRARFADTRAYDFSTGTWEDVTPGGPVPVERCLHGCWWTPDGGFVLYAGQTTGVEALADVWLLERAGSSDARWSEADATRPPKRNLYAYARWAEDMLIFGGRGDVSFRNDLWRFVGGAMPEAVTVAGEPPARRSGATLIGDEGAGRALLFGGKSDDGALDDLWELVAAPSP